VVSGKVTLNGQPVSGEVVFVGAGGKLSLTPIKPDGQYEMFDPPAGKVKVAIRTMGLGPAPGAPGAPPKGLPGGTLGTGSGGGVAPPAKFGDDKKTPISYEVEPGKRTFNLELEKY